MQESKSQLVFIPTYLSRFSCTGSECEDNCCQGWNVYIDPKHYQKIKLAMSSNISQRQAFEKNINVIQDNNSALKGHAKISQNQNKQCNFLTQNRLCELQQCHGETMLPSVCATYPKNQLFDGQQTHISGSLSCPEIARLCLLANDAMTFIESEQHISTLYSAKISTTAPSYYQRYINDIRLVMTELLSLATFSINQRLFFMIFFSYLSKDDFHKTLSSDPSKPLQQHIDYIQQSSTQAEIVNTLSNIQSSHTIPMQIVLAILMNAEQNDYIENLLRTAADIDLKQPKNTDNSLTIGEVYTRYKSRSERIEQIYGLHIEQYFTHYSKNYWFGESYTHSENLIVHARKLLVRIACLRFMFFSHDNLLTLLNKQDIADQHALLDDTAVDVFYRFSRLYEHNTALIEKIEADIIKQDYGLPILAALIKF